MIIYRQGHSPSFTFVNVSFVHILATFYENVESAGSENIGSFPLQSVKYPAGPIVGWVGIGLHNQAYKPY